MYEARTLTSKRKPRIIFDQTFQQFKDFQVGDKGQCFILGVIVADRQEMNEDGSEYLVKTLEIEKVEVITQKDTRTSSSSL